MNERESLRALRQQHLQMTTLPHSDIDQLEQEFGKYLLVPLDLPNFIPANLAPWFYENAELICKKDTALDGQASDIPIYYAVDVVYDDVKNVNSAMQLQVNEDFKSVFPDFKSLLEETLPISNLKHVKFWSSVREIPLHRDSAAIFDFPLGFRTYVDNTNINETLYVREAPFDEAPKERIYIPRHANASSFVWNNLRVKHGSDYFPEHRKMLMIVNRFELDVQRYRDIMRRSIERFKDTAYEATSSVESFR